MDTSAEWEEQLVQLNHIYACLASANKLERTGVSLGDALCSWGETKRSEADLWIV